MDERDAAGAKRLHLAAITAFYPTARRIPPYLPFFMTLHNPMEAPTAERGNARGSPTSGGRTSTREVAGISNFTERGLTRPTRGGEKLGQPPCVTSLPAAKTDADVGH